MKPMLFFFPANEALGEKLLAQTAFETGKATFRRFPDGESYIRILSDVRGKTVYLLCTLHQPDDKLMMLYFFSKTAREQGANSVILLTPYLGYMRQDKAFHSGEAVTSNLFAELLSGWVDALITIDPHLHRHHDLAEIYSIPTTVLHAGPLVEEYIKKHISNPVLIGPDEESEQWVAATAGRVGCEFSVLKKKRFGDREVRISVPDAPKFRQHTPVLVDDIISTGRTMMETAGHLREHGLQMPVCIGIHAVFAGDALEEMCRSGIETIITTNTIPHLTNRLDVSGLLAEQML
jgi:ribose-phosphate pyrophosphokinase